MPLHTKLTALAALALCAAACTHHPREDRIIIPATQPPPPPVVAVERAPLPPMNARVTPPPEEPPPPPPAAWTAAGSTAPQGCTGGFTVREARTGKLVASGRARKDGVLLVEVLANGRDGRRFGSHWTADPARGPSPYQVLFVPDCRDGVCAPR
jgi:hypothetical protein